MAVQRYGVVLFKNRPVGRLQEVGAGGTEFVYAQDCAQDIGCALPRQQRVHPWSEGLHPFFQHLTPEGWLRGKQAGVADLSVEDDLGLLLAFGKDCIGAVSVDDPDASASPMTPAGDPETRAAVLGRRTVSGVQRKLPVVANENGTYGPAPAAGVAPFIAKFKSPDLPDLVLNEWLTLRCAALLLEPENVTEFRKAVVAGLDEEALVVKRFDRTPAGDKLRLEDFAQILAQPRRRDYSGKYDADYLVGGDILRRWSSRPAIDVARYFRRIVVSFLLGDCDAHLKNFSLLETSTGLRLSPAYDIVNTVQYAGRFDGKFGLRIAGQHLHHDDINRSVLESLAVGLGLQATATKATFDDLAKKRDRLNRMIDPQSDSEFRGHYGWVVNSAWSRLFD